MILSSFSSLISRLKHWGLDSKQTLEAELESARKEYVHHEKLKDYHNALAKMNKERVSKMYKNLYLVKQDTPQIQYFGE